MLKDRGAMATSIRIDGKPVSGIYKIGVDVIGNLPRKVNVDLGKLERYYGDI